MKINQSEKSYGPPQSPLPPPPVKMQFISQIPFVLSFKSMQTTETGTHDQKRRITKWLETIFLNANYHIFWEKMIFITNKRSWLCHHLCGKYWLDIHCWNTCCTYRLMYIINMFWPITTLSISNGACYYSFW